MDFHSNRKKDERFEALDEAGLRAELELTKACLAAHEAQVKAATETLSAAKAAAYKAKITYRVLSEITSDLPK